MQKGYQEALSPGSHRVVVIAPHANIHQRKLSPLASRLHAYHALIVLCSGLQFSGGAFVIVVFVASEFAAFTVDLSDVHVVWIMVWVALQNFLPVLPQFFAV